MKVKFEAKPPEPEDEEAPDYEYDEQDREEDDDRALNDFSVSIAKPGSQRGLIVDCTSIDTDIHINNIQMSWDVEADFAKNRMERVMEMYAGPEFHTLDDRLKTSVIDYLRDFGVNEHLAAFIEVYSLDKDQRIYMKWLEHLKDEAQ